MSAAETPQGSLDAEERATLGSPSDAAAEIIARAMHSRTPEYYHSGFSWPLDQWSRDRDMERARGVLERVQEALARGSRDDRERLRRAAQDAAAILRVPRPLTADDRNRAAGILSRALEDTKGQP